MILQLVGNLRIEHLDELDAQIKAAGPYILLDISAVTLISVEGIRYLNSCQELRKGPAAGRCEFV